MCTNYTLMQLLEPEKNNSPSDNLSFIDESPPKNITIGLVNLHFK